MAVHDARVRPIESAELLAIVTSELERTARQVASLEQVVAAIVEGAGLTATDDGHDPEGATVAYERAQAAALLRQARGDLAALTMTRDRLEVGAVVRCSVCGEEIDRRRLAALPTTARCIRCAR